MLSPEDLLFYSEVNIKISRPNESIEYLKRFFIESKPQSKSDFQTVSFIIKSIIDPLRYTLRTLEMEFNDELGKGRNGGKLEIIHFYIQKALFKFKDYGLKIINAITEHMIPKTVTEKEKVFCFKMRADCYRYLAEFVENEEKDAFIEKGKEDYIKASSIAEFLLHSEPLRLSLILNYAIFIFEHLWKRDEAAEMLRKARREAEIDMGQLDRDEHGESLELLNVMRTNLIFWFDDENEQSCDDE